MSPWWPKPCSIFVGFIACCDSTAAAHGDVKLALAWSILRNHTKNRIIFNNFFYYSHDNFTLILHFFINIFRFFYFKTLSEFVFCFYKYFIRFFIFFKKNFNTRTRDKILSRLCRTKWCCELTLLFYNIIFFFSSC